MNITDTITTSTGKGLLTCNINCKDVCVCVCVCVYVCKEIGGKIDV